MKRTLCASFALSILIVGLPLLGADYSDDAGSDDSSPIAEYADTEHDDELSLRLLMSDGSIAEINARDYLIGVTAAEMPASFDDEALKAQSVAARSYLRRYLEHGSRHEGADICASSACCQAYLADDELRRLWGEGYDGNMKKIRNAVAATDGEYLSYEGEAILAAFHSSSSGMTESGAEVWGDVPYLISVSSPEKVGDVPDFESGLSVGEIDFRDTLLHLHPEADFTAPADEWIGAVKKTESGRVRTIRLGGVDFSGAEIRELFSLRSTAFELVRTDGGFRFTVRGYGHGVGMSQYGANVMAKGGADYRDILRHYYPDTVLVIPNDESE